MSRITEYKTVQQEVTVAYQCDVCKKQVEKVPKEWHEFNHHHDAWGNDSIDSYEYFHVCGIDCYVKQLTDSVKEMDHRYGAEIDGMSVPFVKILLERLKS